MKGWIEKTAEFLAEQDIQWPNRSNDMHGDALKFQWVWILANKFPGDEPGPCDFYVKDRETGKIHRVGEDQHDSIWVDQNGQLHYRNIQNGEGCSGRTRIIKKSDYEFVPSDGGETDNTQYIDRKEEEK